MVDIKAVDPTILVELRYAGSNNIAGRALYPPDMPALVRASVAQRLVKAQAYLQQSHYGLKIWDAYRPPAAQAQLWQLLHNASFVANPADGRGSLHTWGVAVDATLVDDKGNELAMPTDFDVFTPAAGIHYQRQHAGSGVAPENPAGSDEARRVLRFAHRMVAFHRLQLEKIRTGARNEIFLAVTEHAADFSSGFATARICSCAA